MLPPVAVLFDVFGTLVDWRTCVRRELAAFGARTGRQADWTGVADDWRGRYQPAMEEVRSGRRPWTVLDALHREALTDVLAGVGIHDVPAAELDELTFAWHRLDPWPDVRPGLERLRTRFTVGTLSNGNTALLEDLAAHAGLSFDHLLGAESAKAYKPCPEAYLRNVALIGLEPAQVMLVAAHNTDLHAASPLGIRTAFIPRPTEHGHGQTQDLVPDGDWDVVASDVVDLGRRLGV